MHAWKAPEQIAQLATLTVLSRGGETVDAAAFPLPVHRVDVARIDVSSSEIRRRVAAGSPIRYLVPEAVRQLIQREHLYINAGQ
jgi:nicotinate-nucleotide adenylyltransferase